MPEWPESYLVQRFRPRRTPRSSAERRRPRLPAYCRQAIESFAAQHQSVINFMLVEARVYFRKQFVNE
jgi:hypothetical protein